MDSSAICDYRMVEYMKQIATKKKIKYQLEILTAGGTDTAGMQRMAKNGTIAGAVSIPTRNIHQVIEMCDKRDIKDSIDLLRESVKSLDTFDWAHK
jgi:endoglucanase